LEDYSTVISLWEQAGLPVRLAGRDSREKIGDLIKRETTLFLVAEIEGKIVGTVLGTHDGRKGWINRLAVDAAFRRQRIASQLVRELESGFDRLGLDVTACLIEAENCTSMDFFRELGYLEWSGKYYSKRKNPES
jgi:N-acetylglutamate synthase